MCVRAARNVIRRLRVSLHLRRDQLWMGQPLHRKHQRRHSDQADAAVSATGGPIAFLDLKPWVMSLGDRGMVHETGTGAPNNPWDDIGNCLEGKPALRQPDPMSIP